MPFNGGEAIALTDIPTGVTNFEWSKNGKKIIFISRMNREELEELTEEKKKELLPEEKTLLSIQKKKIEERKIEPRIITREEYRTGTNYKDDRNGQIYVIDVESKRVENRFSS